MKPIMPSYFAQKVMQWLNLMAVQHDIQPIVLYTIVLVISLSFLIGTCIILAVLIKKEEQNDIVISYPTEP